MKALIIACVLLMGCEHRPYSADCEVGELRPDMLYNRCFQCSPFQTKYGILKRWMVVSLRPGEWCSNADPR